MADPVIKVENLTKEYRLGVINHGTLRQDLQSWWARLRGLEDPNSLLTAANHMVTDQHFLALDDVSFEVAQGEILGIIGRNGAGKSTLLKILSRITAPTSGRVKLKGRLASLLEVGTGFHPELTGRENVYLNGAVLGMSREEVRRKFDEIVAFSEVEKFIDTPVKRFSSGMYVRLAFAVAAHLEPEILVVDEVLAVGDAQFQKKCLGKMEDVGREGRTVLFVSHNMSMVSTLCAQAILLDGGKVVADGDISTVVNFYLKQILNGSSAKYEGQEHIQGKPYLKQAVILNQDGDSTYMVTSGDKITIVFDVANAKRGLSLNFSIYGAIGIKIVNFNTLNLSASDKTSEAGRFVCEIDELLLSEGTYRVNIALIDGGESLEHLESALVFEVSAAPLRGRQIVNANFGTNVLMHHSWSVPG